MPVKSLVLGWTFWNVLPSKKVLAEQQGPISIDQVAKNVGHNVAQKVYIQTVVDAKSGESIKKELTAFPLCDDNFVKREEIAQKITTVLDRGKICYLKGFGGFGKTQLALNHYKENKDNYTHRAFINCENTGSLRDSITTISQCLKELKTNKTPETFEERNKQVSKFFSKKENEYWETTEKEPEQKRILIILDNVDNKVIYEQIKPILRTEIAGNILVTGRYQIPETPNLETIETESVSELEAYEIFRKALNDDKKHENKEKEIKALLTKNFGGSPFLIRLFAEYVKVTEESIDKAIEIFKTSKGLPPELLAAYILPSEVGYHKDLYAATIPHLDAIAEKFSVEARSLVDDFVDFLACIPSSQDLSLHNNEKLIAILKQYSAHSFFYPNHKQIPGILTALLKALHTHSLIKLQRDENGLWNIFLPLMVKWAIMLQLLGKHEELRQKTAEKIAEREKAVAEEYWYWFLDQTGIRTLAGFIEDRQYDLDKQRYKWVCAGIKLIKEAKNPDFYSFSALIDFMEEHVKSKKLKAEIFNSLSETFQHLTDQLQKTSPSSEFFERVDKVELEVLEKTMIGALQSGIKSEQIATALLSLSDLYLTKNIDKSEIILSMSQVKVSKNYHFHQGRYYFQKFLISEEKGPFLEKSIGAYKTQLKKNETSAVHNNLALCYWNLLPLCEEGSSDWQANVENVKTHFSKAIALDPLSALYEKKYTNFLSKYGENEEKTVHDKLSKVLDSEVFKSLSPDYKIMIATFLRRAGSYDFSDSRVTHTMKDRGGYFGSIINENAHVTSIRLDGCHLNDEAVEKIAESLHTNTSLLSLKLEYNSEITDRGVLALVEMLKSNSTLKELSLHKNKLITDDAVMTLIASAKPGFKLILTQCETLKNKEAILQAAKKREVTVIL